MSIVYVIAKKNILILSNIRMKIFNVNKLFLHRGNLPWGRNFVLLNITLELLLYYKHKHKL